MKPLEHPHLQVTFTGHARQRLRQRFGIDEDQAIREVRRAIRLCDVQPAGRNRWTVTRSDRVYVIAVHSHPRPVAAVVTVLYPVLSLAA